MILMRSVRSSVLGLLVLLSTSSIADAYCPVASDVSVAPASPTANSPFQIRLISRLQNWADGSVVANVQGNQILVTGQNGTGPGIPLPEDVAIIEMPGLPAGNYTMVFDIVESTGQVVQCPRFTVPLTIAGAPAQPARAAPALSLPMLAALLVLLLGGGLLATRRMG